MTSIDRRARVSLLALVLALAGCSGDVGDGPGNTDGGARVDSGRRSDASADEIDASTTGVDAQVAGDDASTAVDSGTPPPTICPAGSEDLELDLDGVTLQRVPGVPIDDGFVSGFSIIEGPVWADGALYVSHFGDGPVPTSRIYRIPTTGAVTIAAPNAGTNGLSLSPGGELLGARHADGSISRFDWDDLDAAPTPLVTSYDDDRFNSPNDLVVAANGTIYFTDPGWQAPSPPPQSAERAYRVPPGGAPQPIAGAPSRPNGIALTRDQRTLFVSGTNGLRRYELGEDGAITGGPFEVSAITGGLDGLGLDCAGNLYVTGGDRVRVLDPELRVIGELSAPGATNVAFGGDDRRTLYVTTLGGNAGVYRARLGVPGLPF